MASCLHCNTYLDEDPFVIYCGIYCQWSGYAREHMEKHKIEISEELYKQWLNDELVKLHDMTVPEIEERIRNYQTNTFELKTRLGAAFRTREEKLGNEFRAGRDALITEPNFQVVFQGDTKARKTKATGEKKEPKAKLSSEEKKKKLIADSGIDLAALRAALKAKREGLK